MRYMDQVRVNGDVLVEISMTELVALRRLLTTLLDQAADVEAVPVGAVYTWSRVLESIQLDAAADLYGPDFGYDSPSIQDGPHGEYFMPC